MAVGPGKYDSYCTMVRQDTKAKAVVVIVLEGEKGSGFSCQADVVTTMQLPDLLEFVAAEIRRSSPHVENPERN